MIVNTNTFNNYLVKIIEETSYEFKIINIDESKICSCLSKGTNEPDPSCPKCLGTGHKIVIRDGWGNSQDTPLPTNLRGNIYMKAKNFYIRKEYPINKNDLIIDHDEIYLVFEVQETRGIEGTLPFLKVNTLQKRFDPTILLKNFNNILKRAGGGND